MPKPFTFVLLAALISLATDLLLPGAIAGVPAVCAMALLVALGARVAWRKRRELSVLARLGSVLQIEVLLLVTLVSLALARLSVLVEQLRAAAAPVAGAVRTYDALFLVLAGTALAVQLAPNQIARVGLRVVRRPPALLAGSFAALIAVGTFLLTLPVSVQRLADISLLDALFNMTSAVCVTGLSVNDVSAIYTRFGQAVILAGIQLGGIGMMTLAAFGLSFLHGRALKEQGRYAAVLEVGGPAELRRTVRSVVFATFGIEAAGAVGLYFTLDPALPARAWHAVFLAISAFCNAGFSLFSDNLIGLRRDYGAQAVLMALVVLGGLGFPVLREVGGRVLPRLRRSRGLEDGPRRLSTSARVVLATSALLVVAGASAVALLESNGVLAPLGNLERIFAALFSSVVARSAGFNTVDFGAMHAATLLVVMLLMFIGASPGSTGGGVKTTTAAVLAAAVVAEIRGREPQLAGRAIAPQTLRRALAVSSVGMAVAFVATMLLSLTERLPFLPLAFETVSALCTTGLSTGITGQLSPAGKLVLVVTMFLGRVGPLTVAVAVGKQAAKTHFRLPQEELPIG